MVPIEKLANINILKLASIQLKKGFGVMKKDSAGLNYLVVIGTVIGSC